MAIPATINVTPGSGTGLGASSLAFNLAFTIGAGTFGIPMPQLTNGISPCQTQQSDLTATTEKTITVPAVAQGVIVIPPTGNSALWQYRTNTGVAEQTRKQGVLVNPFDGAVPSTFFLYCASTVSGFTVIFY